MLNLARFFLAVIFLGCYVSHAGTFTAESPSDRSLVKQRVFASQFLSRTTFGPTMDEIDELARRMVQVGTRRACAEWIDVQMAMPASLHQNTIDSMLTLHGITNDDPNVYLTRYRYHAFYHNALRAPDQLRQRVAWALSQVLVVSDLENDIGSNEKNADGVPHWYSFTNYYDKLVANAFGDYRTLLSEVTLHPVMGQFLSHLRNAKADPENNYYPDENYAREVMQLFSIGLYELNADGRPKTDAGGNLIPTYDMDTVQSFARVFTGLTLNDSEHFYWSEAQDYVNPMEMWEEHHDTGAKELLRGTTLPARTGAPGDGMTDINAALDNIASHPNVAPFLAKRLIQRLVRPNPSRAYVRRVVHAYQQSGSTNEGNLGAMIKAILIDPEAWRSTYGRTVRLPDGKSEYQVIERGTEYSRMKEPMLLYLAMFRGLMGTSYYDDQPTPFAVVSRTSWEIRQSPFGAPNVFNFYLPDYQPPGPLSEYAPSQRLSDRRIASPEFTILTPVMNNRICNQIKSNLYNARAEYTHWAPVEPHHVSRLEFDYEQMLIDIDADRAGLIERLDLQFCHGAMPDQTRQDILSAINQVDQEQPWTESYDRLVATLYCVICSPDSWIVP